MHWCMDETLALLSILPFIGYYFAKFHVWWHKKFSHKCHEEACNDTHVEHTESKHKRKVYDGPVKHLTAEDCERLAQESEEYRKALQPRLDRLDNVTEADLKIRCKSAQPEDYNPFVRESYVIISDQDLEYLKGIPAPLKITIPNIKIETDEDDDSRKSNHSLDEEQKKNPRQT